MNLSSSLIRWFQNHKHDLPWRKNRTPYSVWISEIMLQQTIVKTVIPYFEKWMKKYPDVKTLAAAREHDVLRLWEGLGYYTRARNILKAANMIVKDFGGDLPDNEHDLRRLPGIGEYTASAILSIAFNKPHPLIDANVRKVGRRLLGLKKWDKQSAATLRRWLMNNMPPRRAGDFNEALMELGQTICLLENPFCARCPLHRGCLAFQKNRQDKIPGKKSRALIEKKSILLLLIHQGKILIRKKEEGLWKGLWLLPDFATRKQAENFIHDTTGRSGRFVEKLPSRIQHYTRYRERLVPHIYRLKASPMKTAKGWRWASLHRLNRFPFPSTHRIILELLKK